MANCQGLPYTHKSQHMVHRNRPVNRSLASLCYKLLLEGCLCILCKQISLGIRGQYRIWFGLISFFCLITSTPYVAYSAPTVPDVDLRIIAQIETGGHSNPSHAKGDDGMSLGRLQVSRGMLRDFNAINQTHIKDSALFNEATNAHVAIWFLTTRIPQVLESKRIPVSKDSIILAYNGGFHRTPSKKARNYLKKYKRLENATYKS